MTVKIIATKLKGSNSIQHLIGQTFKAYEPNKPYWTDGEIDVFVNGKIVPLLPGEYEIIA